ncbi:hypothetical protein ABGV49_12350 [Chromobacterium vaccinii]|uniref:Uncharacterized protein n=1 Tax=Chromobacterium vaccinii TaxID=1108595 RepID=A0ABV0FCN9_9NEIS
MTDSTFSTPFLTRLLEGGVIEQALYDAAQNKLRAQGHEPFTSLGEALYWLVEQEVLSLSQLGAIEDKADADEGFASNQVRRQALNECGEVLEQRMALRRQQETVSLSDLLPGPWWSWALGGAAIIGAACWYFLTPASVPKCDASEVTKTIRASLFTQQIRQQASQLGARASERPNMFLSSLKQIKEVGYIQSERTRACVAMLTVDKAQVPIAYEVKAKDDDFYVTGENERLLRARYAQVDREGRLPELGKPLGREGVRLAFQQGVEEYGKQGGPIAAILAQMQNGNRKPVSPLGDVLPMNDCAQVEGGVWRCKLMAEYRDPLMAALGKSGGVVLEGEFGFVREGKGWRSADNFNEQFAQVLVQSRLASIKGQQPD